MGHSYSSDGRLCCDNCGNAGQVRKRRCPHKVIYADGSTAHYCYAAALCPACYAATRDTLHERCEQGAALRTAEERLIKARMDTGDMKVSAAWGSWYETVPDGMIGVCFVGNAGEVYRLIPEPDYKLGGWLADHPRAVPWQDHPGETTKQVAGL